MAVFKGRVSSNKELSNIATSADVTKAQHKMR
jgi:hypothetical protein